MAGNRQGRMLAAALLSLLCSCFAAEWQEIEVTATGYCICKVCCGERGVGITADGTDAREWLYGVAADPDRLPYGTVLWIPRGYGYLDRTYGDDDRAFTVDDNGGIIRRRTRATGRIHIDLRFIHHWSAKRFGVRRMTIYVWKP
jgi:3D (Asp-Asp-Asp) domain-containing protein